MDYYDSEIEANEVAVAYWREIGEGAKLDSFLAMVDFIQAKMPVPADTSEEYFNTNYDEIVSPEEYGYFQFMFYKMANENNSSLGDFF